MKAKRLPSRKAIKVGCKIVDAFEEGFAAGCEKAKRDPIIDTTGIVIDPTCLLGTNPDVDT